ncbi:hypothetical protein EST38_g7439 [Candolleomyces aberdarensis]|uniref:CHAT domain-containing protein n=1 Tax=Candolleomyces aberdarensis TaxID=2316362 RepID=A0A4Q2DHZ7_9AGAR|nr:hypothetical protein EST38_g7439 [Candolleomyces aberdarensis]
MDDDNLAILSHLPIPLIKKIVSCIVVLKGDPAAQKDLIGGLCHHRFSRTVGEASYINEAVAARQAAIQLTPPGHPYLPIRLVNLTRSLHDRFEYTGDLKDVDTAILSMRKAVEATAPGDPSMAFRLSMLGNSFNLRFERKNRVSDLDKSISAYQQALRLLPPGDTQLQAVLLNDLGNSLYRRFQTTSRQDDIKDAISSYRRAVAIHTQLNIEACTFLNGLVSALHARFECTGDISDLEECVATLQRVISTTPPGDPRLATWYGNLGNVLQTRSVVKNSIDDINQAVRAMQKAIDLAPNDHAGVSVWLHNLSNALGVRFERTGNIQDLTQSIAAKRKAIARTPPGHSIFPSLLYHLGISLHRHHDVTGLKDSIDEAIHLQTRAIGMSPTGHVDIASRYRGLGISYISRFGRTRQSSDLKEAISAHEKALALTPAGHPRLSAVWSALGNAYRERFHHEGNLKDIELAISLQRKAVESTPIGHKDFPDTLCGLGETIWSRFQHKGAMEDIQESIRLLVKGIGLAMEGHVDLPRYLTVLGVAYHARYQRVEDLTDIEEAISVFQRAVKVTKKGSADLPKRYDNLGIAFQDRFGRSREISDIEEAIAAQKKAIDLIPTGEESHHPNPFSNLGISYHSRYEVSHRLEDLERSIAFKEKAISLTPDGHRSMPKLLNNLGNSLLLRFEDAGNFDDVDKAISLKERARGRLPPEHVDIVFYVFNLGSAWQVRFRRTGDIADIDKAIATIQEAIKLCPEVHASLPSLNYSLGQAFNSRLKHTEDEGDLKQAIGNHRLAAISPYGSPLTRFHAAEAWAILSHPIDPAKSLEAFDTAIRLLSLVAGLEQTVQRRHNQLVKTGVSDFSLLAAATALSLGKSDKALEWLERGRCLVWNQINSLRSPLDELRKYDEGLAKRVLRVSKELETAASRDMDRDKARLVGSTMMTMEEKMTLQDESKGHVKLVKEWEEVLENVRAIPGFESFLRPTSCAELLRNLPREGTVVVINVYEDWCDALALSAETEKPVHIRLPRFQHQEAERLRIRLRERLIEYGLLLRHERHEDRGIRPATERKGGRAVAEVLAALWTRVVKPILGALGFTTSNSPRKRIWWCTTGPLVFLPIHAAGIYTKGDTQTIFDYVVSSYIPTVSSLSQREKSSRRNTSQNNGLLMVSQPNAKNLPPIPGVKKEMALVQSILEEHGVRNSIIESAAATKDATEKHMKDFSCIHLACHASQNALRSSFHLHDGPLDLGAIIRSDMDSADLAFLSACQTSVGDERLPEEVVHLAAGMMAAGYRSVVATMWSIGDKSAPDVAGSFYRHLLAREGRNGRIGGELAAVALYEAVKDLRERSDVSEDSLLKWVPYVHFGI